MYLVIAIRTQDDAGLFLGVVACYVSCSCDFEQLLRLLEYQHARNKRRIPRPIRYPGSGTTDAGDARRCLTLNNY